MNKLLILLTLAVVGVNAPTTTSKKDLLVVLSVNFCTKQNPYGHPIIIVRPLCEPEIEDHVCTNEWGI